jgi:2,3-bisphosphoglycerate-dependent phosphoglycerate mutase
MRTIWLIRHAESRGNAGEMTDLPHSIALTELGHRQAGDLAEHFSQTPNLIVVSRYQRTVETALPTMRRFPTIPVVEWPIHEFTFLAPGHYRGKTQAQRSAPAAEYWESCDPDYCDGEGAESFNDFMLRIRECLERLRRASEPFIAVFAHGYVMKAVLWESLYRGHGTPREFMLGFREFHRCYPAANGLVLPMLADSDGNLFMGTPEESGPSHREATDGMLVADSPLPT